MRIINLVKKLFAKKDPFYGEALADMTVNPKWVREMEHRHLAGGKEKQLWKWNDTWQNFQMQQQEALGFANYGGAIQSGAAVTWLSQSYDNLAVYPAGSGTIPVAGSFVQLNGVVYAIPGTVASTAGTPPPGGVFVVQPQSPGGNAWQVNPTAKAFSQFAIPGSNFPKPPSGASAALVIDSYWDVPDLQVLSTTANHAYIPAPGMVTWLSTTIATTASNFQININGTFTSVFPLPASTIFAPVPLDGLSCRFLSGGTTRNTYTLFRVLQNMQS